MPATTLETMTPLLRGLIEGITPRHAHARDTARWKYTEDNARRPTAVARLFSLEWDSDNYTPDGFMGPAWVDTTATLTVRVDYGAIPRHVVKMMAEDDYYQLRDVISNARAVTVPGLMVFQCLDWDFAPNADQNQAQILYQFEVRYMKERV